MNHRIDLQRGAADFTLIYSRNFYHESAELPVKFSSI